MVVVVLLAGAAEAASNAGRCGGRGPKSATITCASGKFVSGVSARGGSYVDQIGIRCSGTKYTSTWDGPGTWKTMGPGGGNVAGDMACDASHVRRIEVKSGTYVDRVVSASCGSGPGSQSIGIGGTGGSTCELECPQGEKLYSVTITYGSWIDSIAGKCRQ
jgi:hypothetical protein